MSPRYCNDYNPRPTDKVYQLRKQGEIDQAYQCAFALYQNHPNDEDILNAYAWTLIDLCKREYNAGNISVANEWLSLACQLDFKSCYDDFVRNIKNQIRNLKIKLDPHAETVRSASELSKTGNNREAYILLTNIYRRGELATESHLAYGWILYRYLKENSDLLTSLQVRTILRDYLRLKNDRPSQLHSMILNFAINYSKRDMEFKLIPFFRLWGPEYLTLDDFVDSTH